MSRKHFTAAQIEFLKSIAHLPRTQMAEKFNAKFGENRTNDSMQRWCSKNNFLGVPNTGRFIKGQSAWNDGKTGYMGANTTSFKKGNVPHNTKPLFSERTCAKDGYVLIKIREEHPQFVLKHRWLWEQVKGPIPENHKIVFINEDKTDIRIDNLMLVSDAELAVKNIKFSKVSNAETNETCLLLSKLHIAAKKVA